MGGFKLHAEKSMVILGLVFQKRPQGVHLMVYFAFEVTIILGFVFQVIFCGFDPMVFITATKITTILGDYIWVTFSIRIK